MNTVVTTTVYYNMQVTVLLANVNINNTITDATCVNQLLKMISKDFTETGLNSTYVTLKTSWN